jgi:hypothetical protein
MAEASSNFLAQVIEHLAMFADLLRGGRLTQGGLAVMVPRPHPYSPHDGGGELLLRIVRAQGPNQIGRKNNWDCCAPATVTAVAISCSGYPWHILGKERYRITED